MSSPESVYVAVTLPQIYEKVLETDDKVDRLTMSVEQMVSINQRLDDHRERIDTHDGRIRKVESQIAAQWVVVGVGITIIGAAVIRAFWP